MERRGQERDVYYNSNNNPPQISQESPVKLPLAPLVSMPADRRIGNETVSTRRGSAIFSPTQQISDHVNYPPPHLRRLESHPPQTVVPAPDPDPGVAPSNSKAPAAAQQQLLQDGSPPADATAAETVRFRECLKNHAASVGGHVVDGCGEFMAGGEEGTREALRCAACDCHRNFHRKEVSGEQPQYCAYNPNIQRRPNHQISTPITSPRVHEKKPPTMVNFGCGGGGGGEYSSSEELNIFQRGGHAAATTSNSGSKKRHRSKFSQKQKDGMHEFAEKVEWRMQKQNDKELQQFCSEIGVSRQVFKVWMHNNKQARKRKEN